MTGRGGIVAAVAAFAVLWSSPDAFAKDTDSIALGVGYFDAFQQDDEAAEFRVEYRPRYRLWIYEPYVAVKGFLGVAATSSGSFFAGLGPMIEVYIGKNVVLSGSFAPFAYVQGGADKDLGYPLEFRSQAEIAYQFDNLSRLGVAVSHYSNANLGDYNPGAETVSVYYSFRF